MWATNRPDSTPVVSVVSQIKFNVIMMVLNEMLGINPLEIRRIYGDCASSGKRPLVIAMGIMFVLFR